MKKIIASLMLSAGLSISPMLLADMVNINKATAAAIQHNLKGIGEKKAQAIVTYREEHGAFKTLEEIKEVKGIGDGIFKKIKADLSLTKGVTDLGGTAGAKGEKDETAQATKTEKSKPSRQQASEKADQKTGQKGKESQHKTDKQQSSDKS